jgi:hypothetical protein
MSVFSGREIEVIHPHFPANIEGYPKMLLIIMLLGNVHCKLMLLYFPNFIRVVVSSANLQERDWDALSQVQFRYRFVKVNPVTYALPILNITGNGICGGKIKITCKKHRW